MRKSKAAAVNVRRKAHVKARIKNETKPEGAEAEDEGEAEEFKTEEVRGMGPP